MDIQKFLSANFAQRESEIPVPALKSFFAKDEKPVWKVRGLTAAELGRARDAPERSDTIKNLVRAMSGEGDQAAAVKAAMGLSDDEVPKDVSQRIEMLAIASVSPEIGSDNRDVAVRLAEVFPVTFYEITNKIHELTGAGAELGKPKRAGKTQK